MFLALALLFFPLYALQIPYGDHISNKVCQPCHKKIQFAYRIRAEVIEAVATVAAPPSDEHTKVEVYKIISSRDGANEIVLDTAAAESDQNEIILEHIDFVDDNDCYAIIEEEEIADGSEARANVSHEIITGDEYDDQSAADSMKDEPLDAVSFLLEKKELFAANKSGQSAQNGDAERTKRMHVCQVCSKSFARKSNLVDHLRLHANVRLYKCEYCAKSFVQAGNYRSHLRIHTKERPFKCTMCDKTYNQSSALKVHIRSHTNERNYKCTTCEKAFTNSSDLSKHMRVHDPSQKLKCDQCDKTFAQKVNLKNHYYRQHEHKHKAIKRRCK